MAISETTRVWENSKQEGTALLIMLAIADSANEYGHAWPGRQRLAKYARCDIATVSRVIAKIEGDGELSTIRVRGRGNHYCILSGLSDSEKEVRLNRFRQSVRTSDEKSLPNKKSSDTGVTTPVQGQVQKISRSVKNHHIAQKRKTPKPRKPDLLFDAFVEICKLEPKTAGSFIGKFKTMVKDAGYTAEDVRRFGDIWYTREYPGGLKDQNPPSPASVAKYIQWTRETSSESIGVVVDYNDALMEALRG